MKEEILNILKIEQNRLSSINQFLSVISNYSNSLVTILWELNVEMNQLFVVADSFKKNEYPIHSLPIRESITGKAVSLFEPLYIPDLSKAILLSSDTLFCKELGINSFFIIPIKFENGELGALNIYSTKINGFSNEVQNELITISSILPNWYYSLQDRVTFSLIKKVDCQLKLIKTSYPGTLISKEMMREHFQKLCGYISETFQSFETTIILKDPFKSQDEYECLASSWLTPKSKTTYYASKEDGLTAWILYFKKAVHIPDLLQFEIEEHKINIQKQYDGINWKATGDFKNAIASKLVLVNNKTKGLPPIGFIGVPICVGDKIFGIIRCSAAIGSPYYFGSRELEILKLIATRIGEVWNSWIQHCLILEDSSAWIKIINTTGELDAFVLIELKNQKPDIGAIFKKVLSVIPDLVKDASILDVRLFNSETNNLYFFTTYGEAWKNGSEIEQNKRLEKKFSVTDENPLSAGADVFRKNKSQLFSLKEITDHPYDGTFAQTTSMILAPISIGDTVLGVLDVRSITDRPFQSTARHTIELMAVQLGIYYELVNSVIKLKNIQYQQNRTFQDFAHQIRSPILQASIRSRLAIKEANRIESLEISSILKQLNAISGLCNKTNRVATNLRLFSDQLKQATTDIQREVIKSEAVFKLIAEAASDNLIVINPKRKLGINIDKESFYLLDQMYISFDLNMLAQSINILLDNAIKYSYNETIIQISGSISGVNDFQISIKNQGIPINEKEASTLCRIRGWRSENAKMVTGEGGGIGLWLLEKIMIIHGGKLEINPTDEHGVTVIKMVLINKK